jgi:hypothetical protein
MNMSLPVWDAFQMLGNHNPHKVGICRANLKAICKVYLVTQTRQEAKFAMTGNT